MSDSVILTVTGMKCGGCETNITNKLTALAGVVAAKAEHKENQVSVEFDAAKTDISAIKQAITAAGFEVD